MKVLIALVVCTSAVFAQNSDTVCKDKSDGTLVAVAGSNNQFYHCSNCIGYLKCCPAGTIFNAGLQMCSWECCDGGSTSATQPPTINPPVTQTTPRPTTQPPTSRPPVVTGPGSGCCDVCDDTYKPYPGSCCKYIVCDNGVEKVMSCPDGLHWNQNLKTCDFPCNAGCDNGTVVTPSPTSTSRPGQEGDCCTSGTYMQHNDTCCKYVVCDNGVWVEMVCPGGLHWNDKQKTCDWPWRAGCDPNYCNSTGPEVTSAPTVPTTAPTVPTTAPPTPAPTTAPPTPAPTQPPVITNSPSPPATGCPEPECCAGEYQPDSTSPCKYQVCDNGRWVSMNCAPNTIWNDLLKTCAWVSNCNC